MTTGLIFATLWKFGLLRIDNETEIRGIDIKIHGEPAYPIAAYGHGWDYEGDLALDGKILCSVVTSSRTFVNIKC